MVRSAHPTGSRYANGILLTSLPRTEGKNMSHRSSSISRRQFIRTTSAAAIASTALSSMAIAGANEKVLIGIMGASRYANGGNGRGSELALGFAGQKNAEVAFICDVDERHLGKAVD